MTKYRRLNIEELKELEKEFVDFLVLNGIPGADWQKMKTKSPEKADQMIDLFSDVVFEGILRKVKFLDFRSKKMIHTFQCLEEKIILVGMQADENSSADFLDQSYIQTALANPPDDIRVYTTEKKYNKERSRELFDMISNGCVISDGKLFKTLCLVLN